MKSNSTKNTDTKTSSARTFFGPQAEGPFFGEETTKEKTFFDRQHLQTKLTVGEPNDPAEREADAIADQVARRAPNDQTHPPSAAQITPLAAPGLQSKPAFKSPGILDSAAEPEAEETPLRQNYPDPHANDKECIK